MKQNKSKGILISFCGLDGCGKTTQINLLNKYLSEIEKQVLLTKQPTDEVRKSAIFRTYMDTPIHEKYDYRALSLFAASDRIQHSNKVIKPALEEGLIVLSDRYIYSCIANLWARGYVTDTWIYEIASFIPKPDITFFFDIDVETAVKRVRSRESEKDRFIDIGLQYRLREQYLSIAKENNSIIIDTRNSIDECFETVKNAVDKVIYNKNLEKTLAIK